MFSYGLTLYNYLFLIVNLSSISIKYYLHHVIDLHVFEWGIEIGHDWKSYFWVFHKSIPNTISYLKSKNCYADNDGNFKSTCQCTAYYRTNQWCNSSAVVEKIILIKLLSTSRISHIFLLMRVSTITLYKYDS